MKTMEGGYHTISNIKWQQQVGLNDQYSFNKHEAISSHLIFSSCYMQSTDVQKFSPVSLGGGWKVQTILSLHANGIIKNKFYL